MDFMRTPHFNEFYDELDNVLEFDNTQLQDSREHTKNAAAWIIASPFITSAQPLDYPNDVSPSENLSDLFCTTSPVSACSRSSKNIQPINNTWRWHGKSLESIDQRPEHYNIKSSSFIENSVTFQPITINNATKSLQPKSNISQMLGTCTLRTASRKSINKGSKKQRLLRQDPELGSKKLKSMQSHNKVEKNYRLRLNQHFLNLLNVLPRWKGPTPKKIRPSDDYDTMTMPQNEIPEIFKFSKGQVLEMARKHIQALEQEIQSLEKERNYLSFELKKLQDVS